MSNEVAFVILVQYVAFNATYKIRLGSYCSLQMRRAMSLRVRHWPRLMAIFSL